MIQRSPINVAIVGVGNCASSLVQGLTHYRGRNDDAAGLMHADLGGYRVDDIRIVAAWDIDRRKVGQDVATAIFAAPNCTAVFAGAVEPTGATVRMGRLLDGVAGAELRLLADERHPRGGGGALDLVGAMPRDDDGPFGAERRGGVENVLQ